MQLDNGSGNNLAVVTAEDDALGLAVVPTETDNRSVHAARKGGLKQLRGFATACISTTACICKSMGGKQTAELVALVRLPNGMNCA